MFQIQRPHQLTFYLPVNKPRCDKPTYPKLCRGILFIYTWLYMLKEFTPAISYQSSFRSLKYATGKPVRSSGMTHTLIHNTFFPLLVLFLLRFGLILCCLPPWKTISCISPLVVWTTYWMQVKPPIFIDCQRTSQTGEAETTVWLYPSTIPLLIWLGKKTPIVLTDMQKDSFCSSEQKILTCSGDLSGFNICFSSASYCKRAVNKSAHLVLLVFISK